MWQGNGKTGTTLFYLRVQHQSSRLPAMQAAANTDMTRRYAYSIGGSRAVDSAPLSKPKNTTILSSIQRDGHLPGTQLFPVEQRSKNSKNIWNMTYCHI